MLKAENVYNIIIKWLPSDQQEYWEVKKEKRDQGKSQNSGLNSYLRSKERSTATYISIIKSHAPVNSPIIGVNLGWSVKHSYLIPSSGLTNVKKT